MMKMLVDMQITVSYIIYNIPFVMVGFASQPQNEQEKFKQKMQTKRIIAIAGILCITIMIDVVLTNCDSALVV